MGQPDWADFPAPPLFVLGSITPGADLNGTPGMDGSGRLADGWGWTLPLTFPCTVRESAHRKVLPAPGMSSSGVPVKITMSPSASLRLYMTGTSQQGGGDVYLTEYAYPITLSAPSPLTNPLLGDGTNHLVYDTVQPNG